MSRTAANCSSATVISIVVTLLGAVMIKLAGPSHTGVLLGLFVLTMGLVGSVVSMLRSSRVAAEQSPAPLPAPRALRQPPVVANLDPAPGADLRLLAQFNESFESWRNSADDGHGLWASFDRWLRDTLHQLAGGRRVRCFAVDPDDRRLTSLAAELHDPKRWTAAERALIDHILDSGCALIGDSSDLSPLARSLLADAMAEGPDDATPPRWLLPIRSAGRPIGFLMVGELENDSCRRPELLTVLGGAIELMWQQVYHRSELLLALRTDRASGLLNRSDLGIEAERILNEAAAEDEPIVLLAVAIEGLRRLEDGRHWELQNWLMQKVGEAMRRRLRTDDIIGRFSDDRFVAVLRRLDLGLGELIARKVLASIREVIQYGDAPLPEAIRVRCGLAAGTRTGFEELLGRACDALHQAREGGMDLASDPGTASHMKAVGAGAAL